MDLDSKNTYSTLFESDWFYDVLVRLEKFLDYLRFELILWHIGLGLNIWIKLLVSDGFYYNQVDTMFEKSENLLELSVKQLVIQSRLASLIFLGQAMFGK